MSDHTVEETWKDCLEGAARLVREAARSPRRTLRVSPDVAAWLDAAGATPSAVEAAPEAVIAALEELRREVAACTRCALHATRTQTVFADGPATAKLVFVGEAPGADEDREGVPFVGKAGQLLTAIIEKGMNLPRGEVYICNVLKCRPPNNRDPLPEEAACCEPYLARQLELLQPKVICALGRHAARLLLQTDESIGRLRGRWHFYRGIPVRVTYHPSYLLRTPEDKRKTWDDVREVLKVYRGEVTPRPDAP